MHGMSRREARVEEVESIPGDILTLSGFGSVLQRAGTIGGSGQVDDAGEAWVEHLRARPCNGGMPGSCC